MKGLNGWGSVAVASVAAFPAIPRGPVKGASEVRATLDRPARYGNFAAQTEAVGTGHKPIKKGGGWEPERGSKQQTRRQALPNSIGCIKVKGN